VKNASLLPHTFRFGVFELNPSAKELRKQGMRIRLQGQPVEILTMLLEQPGELITREELQKKLWPADTFVDFEQGLNNAMKRLRAALDDNAETPRFIETLPRRGYRFIAPVENVAVGPAPVPPRAPVLPTRKPFSKYLVIGAAALVVLLVVAGIRHFGKRRKADIAAAHIDSIAVLPLENLSGDPKQEYFADAMTDALITELGKVGVLRVISRTSVMQYKGQNKPLSEIAGELNVDAVLEGSVLREGDRVRITAQLVRADPEEHVWAESYERDVRDILALQAELIRAITKEVKAKLTPAEEARLTPSRRVEPEAYELYLQGRFLWEKRTKESHERAIELLQESLQRDPDFALAYVGLARAYVSLTGNGFIPASEGTPRAEKAALRAIELNPTLGEAHAPLGFVHTARWEWAQAEKAYRRALELSPNDPITHLWYGYLLEKVGRRQENLFHRQRAYELDPLNMVMNASLGRSLYEVGREGEAMERLHRALELHPESAMVHESLGSVYFRKKDYAAARRELEDAARLCGRCSRALGQLGHVYGVGGRPHKAAEILAELKRRSHHEFVSPYVESPN
jgi:TolB-like protein/DNA-binding winged helix-turn-helix (wHTH) protein/Flp pilus assembly protein TadD